MSATVTIHRIRFTEDEITIFDDDGNAVECCDPPYDDDHTWTEVLTYDPKWDDVPRVDWAVDMIDREGLSFDATGSDWACDPDGSQIIDYYRGEREEVSAHLSGFTPTEVRFIMARVG